MKNMFIAALLGGSVLTGAVAANAFTGPEGAPAVAANGVTKVDDGERCGPRGRRPMRGGMMRGHGPRAPMMMMEIMRQADTDKDGKLTQEELDAFVTAKVDGGDADGDGTITLEEFRTIYLDLMSRQIVDRFQALDEDGDGRITSEEVNEKFGGAVARMDRNGDGALSREDRMGRIHGRKGEHGGRHWRHGEHHGPRCEDGPRHGRGWRKMDDDGPRWERRGPRAEREEMERPGEDD